MFIWLFCKLCSSKYVFFQLFLQINFSELNFLYNFAPPKQINTLIYRQLQQIIKV